MIKNFKRSDIQTTPFVATKPWVLSSFHNQDLIIAEEGPTEVPIAQEFIDYEGGDDFPIINRECNIALEQQTADKVIYEEGEKITGVFYPDSEPTNNNGTFKRLVYDQIKNAFYNTYNNPTKMFGMENIDFELSETKKFLADYFRVFNISRDQFGEKMLENSIVLVDNALDDNFEIVDDGKGNIVAKENLFSRIQEVRKFYNIVNPIDTNNLCNSYYTDLPTRQAGIQGGTSSTGTSGTGGPYGTNNTSSYLPPVNCQPW